MHSTPDTYGALAPSLHRALDAWLGIEPEPETETDVNLDAAIDRWLGLSPQGAHRGQRAHRAITRGMRYPAPTRTALLLASRSGADARTCERAIREGSHVIRTRSVREAIELAARDLGIALPAPEGTP